MGKTILVVEDSHMNMNLISSILRNQNHSVLEAVDADAGIEIARSHHPDLILMDIQLPGRDGLEATAVLKQDATTRDIPIVALTALAMKGDADRILAGGCDGYIAKPVHYRELVEKIALFLQRGAQENDLG